MHGFFTRGLALSLLQRKPDEWRRQHATPSSSGATTSSANNIRLKPTAPSTGTVPTNKHDDREEALRKSSPAKERKSTSGALRRMKPTRYSTM
jgi:hypothetical protein